ncbi:MAG: SprB repeat-containing protein, partial [Flavobacteriales bacterium]|nr:SprB repeat-containing protein [Flavobacteriales bacterium]
MSSVLFLCRMALGQNLVLDPSFENWTGIPGSPLPSANMLQPLNPIWYEANGSADCVHLNNATGVTPGWLDPTCPLGNGQIQCGTPHTGSGVLGCYKANGAAGTKEWAATALASPMVPGQFYRVGFWIQNKKDNPTYIMETNQWGAFFSTTALPAFNPNSYSFSTAPNDWVTCTQVIAGSQWQYLEWCYVPQQPYTHLYLGYMGDVVLSTVNAWSNSGSVGFYVWIDDVVVEAISPSLNVIPDMTICNGDSVQLWASSDLAISWDGGVTTDTAIWVSPNTTTTYYVQTITQGSCQLIDSVTVTVVGCNCNIVLQNSIVATDDTGCPGAGCNGNALVTPQNGAAPYSFVWDDPSAQAVANAVGLCAGTYSCAVMDADGCMDTVSVTLLGPTFPTLGNTSVDETCLGVQDGSVDLTVTGGSGPFSYDWSNGALTQDLSGIGGGTYTVEVTDS